MQYYLRSGLLLGKQKGRTKPRHGGLAHHTHTHIHTHTQRGRPRELVISTATFSLPLCHTAGLLSHTCTHTNTHFHTYTHTQTQTQTQTHIYTHMHIHIQTDILPTHTCSHFLSNRITTAEMGANWSALSPWTAVRRQIKDALTSELWSCLSLKWHVVRTEERSRLWVHSKKFPAAKR